MKSQLYEQDFLRWTEKQAALLRAGRFSESDLENLIAEIEDMGKEQKVALQSLFRQIIIHLLKLDLSPTVQPCAAWIEEVSEFRAQAETRIEETPSLKHYAEELFLRAWPQARRSVEKAFQAYGERVNVPVECPYTLKQVMDSDFLPQLNDPFG